MQWRSSLSTFDIDPKLLELIKIRVSQINGCGYCLNKHALDARKIGESEQRLYTLAAWWETNFFTEEEEAVLKLAEELTNVSVGGVSDAVYEQAVKYFGMKGVAQLILAVIAINGWNRFAIATHMIPA
jgi:AhpD family alkylhydroperoxidase